MITNQVIQNTIDELNSITKVDFVVYDVECGIVASTSNGMTVNADTIDEFVAGSEECQTIEENSYCKVWDDSDVAYIVVSFGLGEMATTMVRVVASQLQSLMQAYKERIDRNNFFK